MLKTVILDRFGTQQKVAEALTQRGFKCSRRNVSAWPEVVPLKWAVPLAEITGDTVDLGLYRQQ